MSGLRITAMVCESGGHKPPPPLRTMPHYRDWFSFQPQTESFGSFTPGKEKGRGATPISGEGAFKPQGVDDKGSIIVGDNHFKTEAGADPIVDYRQPDIQHAPKVFQGAGQNGPNADVPGPTDRFLDGEDSSPFKVNNNIVLLQEHNRFSTGGSGDSITGSERAIEIWTNGGASTLTPVANQNGTATFAPGSAVESLKADRRLGDTSAPSGSSCLTECLTPIAGMNSLGESLNPVLEVGGTADPGQASHLMGKLGFPTNNVSMYDH